MKGSHGVKPAVEPLSYADADELRRIVENCLEYLKTPWEGDRIAEGGMRMILTMAQYTLDSLDLLSKP